jgi:hypothetical protein
MYFYGDYGITLQMTKTQAQLASHPGQCHEDVEHLSKVPVIARQLQKIDPERLILELREYGAWDAEELADHEQNLQRILWIAAGTITSEINE